jgi:hypothetical protein
MPEIKSYTLNLTEVAELLIKKLDIHEGLWGVSLEFGLAAGMVPANKEGQSIFPAIIGVVNKIGIQRFDSTNSLTVDAAQVNPPKPVKRRSRSAKDK